MRLILFLSLVLGSCALTAAENSPESTESSRASWDPSSYTHCREVDSKIPEMGLYRLVLDPELHRLAGDKLGRLTLVRRLGEDLVALPTVFRSAESPSNTRESELLPHRVDRFEELPDRSIEITVSLLAGKTPPQRLEIATPLRDFEKGVTISAPNSDGGWTELVKDGVIFDHSRFLDFRRTSLVLPKTSAQRFRIRIAEASDTQQALVREITRAVSEASGVTMSESSRVQLRDFRIDELRFYSARRKEQPSDSGRRKQDLPLLERRESEEGQTELIFDTGFLPLSQLLVSSESRNFRRAVEVQIPDESAKEQWRTIHRAWIHHYEVGSFKDKSLFLRFPEIPAERIRLLIEHGDNPPLGELSVSGQGARYELVFLAEKGESLALYGGGGRNLTPPRLDTAAIEAALARKMKVETLAWGEFTPNPQYRETAAAKDKASFLDTREALWITIAFVVAVLIWVIYGALRKVEASEDE